MQEQKTQPQSVGGVCVSFLCSSTFGEEEATTHGVLFFEFRLFRLKVVDPLKMINSLKKMTPVLSV